MAYYLSRMVQILQPYLSVIRSAFAAFPIVAFIITLPYMIWQYKKFGSIPLLRTGVIYSFVLYCMAVYYLAILPLPTYAEVLASAPKLPQFIPYNWLIEQVSTDGASIFTLTGLKTFIKLPALRETLFNICMFLPLGVYLRYYFRCKFARTAITGFFCSLFIELTQLSGLYFIYPHAYRTFDTTDLCNNTLGAVIGYIVTPLICFMLPSREKMDERAYKKGANVPLFRRLLGLAIDWVLFVGVAIGLDAIFISILPSAVTATSFYLILYALFVLLYFVTLQTFTHGRTLGQIIMQMRIVKNDGSNPTFWRLLIRYGILYFLIAPSPFIAINCAHLVTYDEEGTYLVLGLIGVGISGILLCTFVSDCLMKLLGSKHEFLYGRISGTKCESTIEIPDNIEMIIKSEEAEKEKEKEAREAEKVQEKPADAEQEAATSTDAAAESADAT